MTQQINPYLQEIQRLNIIINALVESNQQLRRHLNAYQHPPTINSSLEENARQYSTHEPMVGEVSKDSLQPQTQVGISEFVNTPLISSTLEKSLSDNSNLEFNLGEMYNESLLPLTMLGGNLHVTTAYPSNPNLIARENASYVASATASAEVKEINQQVLCTLLRKEMKTCTHRSITTAATLLAYFEHSATRSYKEMQQVTGLSEDGLYKHLAMLIKRKLVVRKAYRTFELTAKALEMLTAARQ